MTARGLFIKAILGAVGSAVLEEKNVEPAVVIEIEEGGAGTDGCGMK